MQRSAEVSTGENGPLAAQDPMDGKDTGEEEQLEQALETLKEMHIQLRGLRTTIPRLVAPLATKQPSPEALFREFSESVNTANQELQDFRRLMTDEGSVKVMAQASKSRTENPNGIRPWKVTEHPDWLTRGARST
ncbi:hypothetical protein LZ554_003622 [Drepanopeziza brunnea f. sp. 'monogermtubi']|nr:hypothetical protein LZ554_003622 [Drepanopeziza brunnea f. sp. 'monogermtubi']